MSQLKIQKCECGHKCCESYYVPEITSTGRMPLETAQKVACVDEMLEFLIKLIKAVLKQDVLYINRHGTETIKIISTIERATGKKISEVI